ncbi:glycosyltransferase family 2 protein [Streptomyces sp. NPDC059398]|uniref:glycosyltransferase family 2 protein n=1 Tax=Streptomyces sp. NPDC059398 TaxID=3346820 RepID=UPI003689AEDF
MSTSEPDVTVVVGAYEAMPYLVKCLESVEAQTLGAERIEIVAVDDGSTDGTGEYLEEFAARSAIRTTVVRQKNSGGPSGPRNVGLGLARGRYVFFLDADDYFGEEALERMVAMGDRAGTDVVLGKVVGVNRGAPKSMWRETVERADVFDSQIKFTLSAQKLFRRSLLERLALTFDESLKTGEDALFTLETYLRGDGVSVISDYTCYYLVGRDDGKHVTKSGSYVLRFDSARALMGLVGRCLPPGVKRDKLMVRPFVVTLLPQFGPGFLKQTAEVQQKRMELAAPLMAEYWNPGVAGRLKPAERLRLHCVALGRTDLLIGALNQLKKNKQPERVGRGLNGTYHLALPYFRDPLAGIPDYVYAMPCPPVWRRLPAAGRTRIRRLRKWASARPVQRVEYPRAGGQG